MVLGDFVCWTDPFVRVLGMLGWMLFLGIPSLQSLTYWSYDTEAQVC